MPSGCEIVVGDHDFHVVNLTPSVTLLKEVKSDLVGNDDLTSVYKVNCIFSHIFDCDVLMYVCLRVFFILQELCMFS